MRRRWPRSVSPLSPVLTHREKTGGQQALAAADTAESPGSQESVPALPAEAEQIRQALAQAEGNVVRAARLLGESGYGALSYAAL